MANANSTANTDNPPTRTEAEINRLSVYERFRWLNEGAQKYPLAAFVEQVKDMAGGITLALEIVEMSDIQRKEALNANDGSIITPVIRSSDACILRRFAIAASRMLAERSKNLCDSLNHRGAEAVQEDGLQEY